MTAKLAANLAKHSPASLSVGVTVKSVSRRRERSRSAC